MSKVLLIEPDEQTRSLYKTAISFQKLEVIAVANIHEGLEFLNEKPDLVLVDYSTQDLSFVDLVKIIKEKAGKVPLLIIADMKNEDELTKCSIDGACDYLAKSNLKVGDVIRKVRGIIDEGK